MSDEESSSSSSEDETFQLNEEFEQDFLKTLSSLKNKDPSIYDEKTKFFRDKSTVTAESTQRKENKKSESTDKPFTIAEYERKMYFETNGKIEDVEPPPKKQELSYVEEQRQLKDSFKTFLADTSSESESEDNALLKKHSKTVKEKEQEEADYIQWLKGQRKELDDKVTQKKLKPLYDYWNSRNLDEDESYLRDFILNKRFLNEKNSEDGDEADMQSDDSTELQEIEDFEQKFNSRFENEEDHDDLIKRYPRTIEGSLRRKNDKRKRKRTEIKERKEKEKKKKRDEINKQKNIKSRELQEKLEELKRLTGNEHLAFKDEDILNDFNSKEFDQRMSSMFNDEFYSKEDSEKPGIDDIEGLDQYGNNEDYFNDNAEPEDIMDCEPGPTYREKKLTRTKKKKKEKRKKSFTDFSLLKDKPAFNPEFHESYNKFMDEFYQLDCEDFIGDMPTRYKYRSVEPNDFGLTVEEILMADEKELNDWSSAKKLTKIRPNHVEKNEAMIYKKKAQNDELKKKILPSLYECSENPDSQIEEEVLENAEETSEVLQMDDSTQKKKKKSKPWFKPDRNKTKHNFHDSRLEAYGINPKKFKPK